MRQIFCGGQKLPEMNFFFNLLEFATAAENHRKCASGFCGGQKAAGKGFFF
jgi:hypothetical protein